MGEPTLLYLVKQVELAIRARLDELVRPAGLTTLQYTALSVLEDHPGLTASALARHSFVTAQSTSELVTALLAGDLVERHRDPSDRRRLVLTLTPAGQGVLDRLRPQVATLEEQLTGGLTGSQAVEFRRALASCRRSLSERSYD